MRLTSVTVKNFRGLVSVSIPLSSFVCIIGENNAGKSSLMLALLKFVEGGKLDSSYFFDPSKDVTISVRLEEISDDDLAQIANLEHRSRFAGTLRDRSVTLVRRFSVDATSRLRRIALVPNDPRFDESAIDSLLSGKRPGAQFAKELEDAFAELKGAVDSKTNQGAARQLIDDLGQEIPQDAKHEQELDLPSGIDNSVRPILPEPIYIPGVKDLADEMKTKDSSNFGRLLGILLSQITPELSRAEEAFSYLRRVLNRVPDEAGGFIDERLEAVQKIEHTVERFVKDSFPKAKLDVRIPPPEIKTILSSAEVWVDDGVSSPVGTKGDGLKRAVTFAILRAYVEMKNSPANEGKSSTSYLFLFEEPELFLHPVAQRALFDALTEISKTNHVVMSTHSPMFFQPGSTKTFVKMAKVEPSGEVTKPCSKALTIDLSDLDTKTQFQLITYETSNAAFFSKAVVLIEGDSDYLVLPHIAKLLRPEWNSDLVGLAFCRVSGKGSMGRYRKFFNAFDIPVSVIADLDCVIDGFEHLEPSRDSQLVRERLLREIDDYIAKNEVEGTLSAKDLRDIRQSTTKRAQFAELRRVYERCRSGNAEVAELEVAGSAFFEDENLRKRRTVLQTHPSDLILTTKRDLLRLLREDGVHLLEKGEIEAYYPDGVTGADKPSKALSFCSHIDTRDKAISLCDYIPCPTGPARPEFELIFEKVFSADLVPIPN